MSEKSSEKSEMSELVWASQMLRECIAPPGAAGSKSERIHAAARALRWKFSRAKSVWYADERTSIKPREIRKIEEITGVKYGREEVYEIDQLIERADALLASRQAYSGSAVAAALRALIGALDRPGTGA